MDRHWAYCSACDRQVEVLVKPGARTDPSSGRAVDEVVCLAYGHTCTGALCPITDLPTEDMRDALERRAADGSEGEE